MPVLRAAFVGPVLRAAFVRPGQGQGGVSTLSKRKVISEIHT
jgi:hypothetical protein